MPTMHAINVVVAESQLVEKFVAQASAGHTRAFGNMDLPGKLANRRKERSRQQYRPSSQVVLTNLAWNSE